MKHEKTIQEPETLEIIKQTKKKKKKPRIALVINRDMSLAKYYLYESFSIKTTTWLRSNQKTALHIQTKGRFQWEKPREFHRKTTPNVKYDATNKYEKPYRKRRENFHLRIFDCSGDEKTKLSTHLKLIWLIRIKIPTTTWLFFRNFLKSTNIRDRVLPRAGERRRWEIKISFIFVYIKVLSLLIFLNLTPNRLGIGARDGLQI